MGAGSTAVLPWSRILPAAPGNGPWLLVSSSARDIYLLPSFKNEVYSDLTGERGVLMGALAGVMEAQYSTLRKHGHSPSEAFNETVEELNPEPHPAGGTKWHGLDVCQL